MSFQHYGRFYQKLNSSASPPKRKLNSGENHTTQASQVCYDRLRPITFGNRIGLSIGGKIFWKCGDCKHLWVKPHKVGEITVWHCERCNAPRLAQRRKPDQELITELLKHPELKGWERLFTQTHSQGQGLAIWQREKLQGIAQSLGIKTEQNCSLSGVEGVES